MKFPRSSGVLLHPTSFPSPHGIGDLGDAVGVFLEFLSYSKQYLWQVLPLGPTGYGDSPYQCFSAFAGNPYLISLEKLHQEGLLTVDQIAAEPHNPIQIEYGSAIGYKVYRLRLAHQAFRNNGHATTGFDAFVQEHAEWLEDYALFMALKEEKGGAWTDWELDLIQRKPEALAAARERLAETIDFHHFIQWKFFQQWDEVRTAANEKGILIMGDIPIFVAHDSADVWANPGEFYLEPDGKPTVVAGVPPDYFSATGQRWGNPLYRWDLMEKEGFSWWIKRVKAILQLVDIIRIDHFRGFDAYWEIPASEPTAIKGKWVKAPGAKLFQKLQDELGELPIIAENLGVITPTVEALREKFGFPGMKIVQFAFGDDTDNVFLPHNYDANNVVYTGTHDNETTLGWFFRTDTTGTTGDPAMLKRERDFARRYARILTDTEAHWDLMRLAWMSVADIALVPMQDLMGLGNEARMNFPSSDSGNWQWRYTGDQLTTGIANRLLELTETYGRVVQYEEIVETDAE